MNMFSRQFPIKRTNSRGHTTIIEGPNLFGPKSSFQPPKKMASFKGGVFFGKWNELFWQNRLGPSIIVVWPRELVRLIGNRLENVFIIYHMVIRRLEKFLRACEVHIQIFWHLKKHENQHDLSIFYIVSGKDSLIKVKCLQLNFTGP